ncbi:hypothetical protein K1719_034365 [Acacia pycnantha]|nr:hypothetical protein K1719_034365 [Acacia pycnantha]
MIRQLHRDPNVLFARYKLPHPLKYKIIVRVGISCIHFGVKNHTTSLSSPMQMDLKAYMPRLMTHVRSKLEPLNLLVHNYYH